VKSAAKIAVRIADMRMRTKFMLIYGLLFFLITLGLTYTGEKLLSQALTRENEQMAQQALALAESYLSRTVISVKEIQSQLLLNKTVSAAASHMANIDTYALDEQMLDMDNMKRFFFELQRASSAAALRFYVPDGLIYSNEGQAFLNFNQVLGTDWYQKLLRSNGQLLWYSGFSPAPGGVPVFSVLRVYKNPVKLSETIGIIRIDIDKDEINDMLGRAKATPLSAVCLFDAGGSVLASAGALNELETTEIFRRCQAPGFENWGRASIGGETVVLGMIQVEGSSLTLVSMTPVKELLRPVNQMRRMIWSSMAILLAFFLFIIYLATRLATRRVHLLNENMKAAGRGKLLPVDIPHGHDEVGELIDTFNFMIGEISRMMRERYQSGVNLKSAELKALQAQINPHFLYNTLDMIHWMAVKSKAPEISRTVIALAKYFKLSLSNGKDIVTLRDELEHVSMYVSIQNQRLDNGIEFQTDVEEDLLACLIPKITLQPIVENAILHGIMMKPDKRGILRISGKKGGGTAALIVSDDGVGFPEERLQEIMSGESSKNGGYGVRNVQERIKLYFGEGYGMTYHSVPGEGTSVEIAFPIKISLSNTD